MEQVFDKIDNSSLGPPLPRISESAADICLKEISRDLLLRRSIAVNEARIGENDSIETIGQCNVG